MMPAFAWPTDPSQNIIAFEQRHKHPDAGALIEWARLCVEALHYLDDVDGAYELARTVPGEHRSQVAEVAHASWATGTCITQQTALASSQCLASKAGASLEA